jgi:ABC-2 type transport system ATP-binding protein
LSRRGKTLVYTTHYMEEAERLCDRILIIDHGRILADDTLAGLLAKVPVANRVLVDVAEDPPPPELIEALRHIAGVHRAGADGARIALDVDDLGRTPLILDAVSARNLAIRGFASERANLESVFLTLTGRSLRD